MQILTSDRAYQLPCTQGKERRTVSFFSFPPSPLFPVVLQFGVLFLCWFVGFFFSPFERELGKGNICGRKKSHLFVGEAKGRDYLIECPACSDVPWETKF